MNNPDEARYEKFMNCFERLDALECLERDASSSIEDFPRTEGQKDLWKELTDPQFLDIIEVIVKLSTNKHSQERWKKALADCRRRAKNLAATH